jgi:hypothetical protein
MVEVDEARLLVEMLLDPERREGARLILYHMFRFGNVFTPEEIDRVKKAIEGFLNVKITGWAMAMYYAGKRQLLSGFEDRCCRYCWRELKSTLEAIKFQDEAIMKKIEAVLNDPRLQLIARC